jgi:hypothetical protein
MEASNAELFASNFKEMEYVKVPAIYWEYTTPQVPISNHELNFFLLIKTLSLKLLVTACSFIYLSECRF